jgi:hypothetical protein
MHPQLDAVVREFAGAEARLGRLAGVVPAGWWTRRADPARWSMAECVAHLNLTARAFLPLIRAAIAQARKLGGRPPARYRRDPVGWVLWRTSGPPVRHRVRTTAVFIPQSLTSEAGLLEAFATYQAEQVDAVRQADGLPLQRVRVTSPFDPRIRYSLYSCLTILPPHQHRHLWQAEQVLEQLRRVG